MEDVFAEIEHETGSKANWISVNLKAMSINHEPSTEFEKRAAREIATGEIEAETTEDGHYRRATAIPMTGGCISCHAGDNSTRTAVEGLAVEKSAAVEQPTVTTVSQARRQAEILHSTLHSSLRVIHDRYYREDEALPIPAAILGEVFKDVEAEQHVKLRWLAVEGLAMNSDHKPADEFERQAAEQLKAGKRSHEIAADGLYRRAAPITLSGHCLKCHMPDRRSTRDRVAGLIIAIPVTPESRP
jgi:mono/diheme cytochrome c family protein